MIADANIEIHGCPKKLSDLYDLTTDYAPRIHNCSYCNEEVYNVSPIKINSKYVETTWELIAQEHDRGCWWVKTRAATEFNFRMTIADRRNTDQIHEAIARQTIVSE